MKAIRTLLPCLLLVLWAIPAAAAIHRCTGADGKPYFSDTPCADARPGNRDEPLPQRQFPAAPAATPALALPPATPVLPRIIEVPPEQLSMVSPAPPRRSWRPAIRVAGFAAILFGPLWLVMIAFRTEGWMTAGAVARSDLAANIFTMRNFGLAWPPLALVMGGLLLIALPAGFSSTGLSSRASSYLTRCDTKPAPETNGLVLPFVQSAGVCLLSSVEYQELSTRPPPDSKIDKTRVLQWRWCPGWNPGEDCESVYQSSDNIDLSGDGPHVAVGRYGGNALPPGRYNVQFFVQYMRRSSDNFEVFVRTGQQ